MSFRPPPFRPGQLLTAGRLNELRREGVRDQQMRVFGPGGSVVDDYMSGGQAAHQHKPQVQLCQAVEDFAVNRYTDMYSRFDPIPTGLCRLVRMNTTNGEYEIESDKMPVFRVWDPMAFITQSQSKQQGDSFYAAVNKDTGRLEIVGSGGGVEIRHGLVSECLGMGWYRVELMDCVQYEPPDCELYDPWTGTSGGSSKGSSGSSSDSCGPPEQCDDCDFRAPCGCKSDSSDVNLSEECGDGDIIVPLRPRRDSKCYPLVGNGTFVYALDKRTVPLKVDGMVTIIWFGDRCLGKSGWESNCSKCPSTSSGSDGPVLEGGPSGSIGSGSGSACTDDGEKLYMVVNGEYQMVNIPIKEYECCDDGTVQQVSCVTYVVEGSVCRSPETPCGGGG